MATIECCEHRFCYECIYNWALKSSNTCPNCKKKFNSIKKLDFAMNEINVKIKDKECKNDEPNDTFNCF